MAAKNALSQGVHLGLVQEAGPNALLHSCPSAGTGGRGSGGGSVGESDCLLCAGGW